MTFLAGSLNILAIFGEDHMNPSMNAWEKGTNLIFLNEWNRQEYLENVDNYIFLVTTMSTKSFSPGLNEWDGVENCTRGISGKSPILLCLFRFLKNTQIHIQIQIQIQIQIAQGAYLASLQYYCV